MNNQPTSYVFPHTQQHVRTITLDGEPWFIAADVCAILGHTEALKIVKGRLEPDEYVTVKIPHDTIAETDISTTNRTLNPLRLVVSESGLYSLILWSHKPEAKTFRRWVTHEVLPQLSRTGSYSLTAQIPRTLPEALRAHAAEIEAREAAQQQVSVLEPPARAWTHLAASEGDYSLRDAAQILTRDPSITTGQNRLSRYLREQQWCSADGRPYQTIIERGWLAVRLRTYTHPRSSETCLDTQLRIRMPGLAQLHQLLGGTHPLATLLNTPHSPERSTHA